MNRQGERRLLVVAVLGLVLLAARPAFGAEAITNGGFESGDQGWTPILSAAVCDAATCPGDTPHSGARWVRLGGGTASAVGENNIGQISQEVEIRPPATLTLELKITKGTPLFGQFQVLVDNVAVETISHESAVHGLDYATVTVPLSAYPGSHKISLYGHSVAATAVDTFTRYSVDDVSLIGADPPPGAAPNPTCAGRDATVIGTADTEILRGTPNADVIFAGDGDDVVRAGAGNDVVCGGGGNDELKGSSGKDRLLGETGRDKLNGGGGRGDRCDGGPSRDKATRSCEKPKRL
jgi:Ca2+-binding RTX toxin-like protein